MWRFSRRPSRVNPRHKRGADEATRPRPTRRRRSGIAHLAQFSWYGIHGAESRSNALIPAAREYAPDVASAGKSSSCPHTANSARYLVRGVCPSANRSPRGPSERGSSARADTIFRSATGPKGLRGVSRGGHRQQPDALALAPNPRWRPRPTPGSQRSRRSTDILR